MSKAKLFSLSEMVDTDAEEEVPRGHASPSPDSNQENKGTKRKSGRSKANAKRFTKPKRLSGDSAAANPEGVTNKSKVGRKRAPLKDQGNVPDPKGVDEIDECAQSDTVTTQAKINQPRAGAKRKAHEKASGRPSKAQATKRVGAPEKDGEFEYTPTQDKGKKRAPVPGNKLSGLSDDMGFEINKEVPETQVPPDAHGVGIPEGDKQDETDLDQAAASKSSRAQGPPKQRPADLLRRRAGSASDTERAGSDPTLRRRLGDLTRKHESLELRYRDLKEIGVKEAEINYERLRKQSEVNAKAANDLITSLKKEIATQKAIAHEVQSLQSQAQTRETDLQKTRTLADQLSKSLADTQNENKVLQAKLANSRSTPAGTDRTPGSAIRGRNQLQSHGESFNAMQLAQLKEDLYSDLTGLILRGVEIGTDSDIFDCIQTGRNGTLHFKLSVAKDSDDTYENTEFQYTPRLDSNRDRALIDMLPDYLTDEIAFSRANAAMFYGRVVDTLTKKRVVEADE